MLMGLTFPIVFGLLFLVVPLQELIGGPGARLLVFVAAFAAACWFARAGDVGVDRLGWVQPRGRPVALGFGIGAGLVAVVVMVMVAAGWYALTWSGRAGALLSAVVSGVAVGLYEEALFRSLWFGGLEPVLGTWLTLAVSAAFFGFIHSFNPGATLVSSVAIALTAGVLLGAVFILRRDLWLVAAMHAAWNATLGGVFGMPVSGNTPAGSSCRPPSGGPTCGPAARSGRKARSSPPWVVAGAGLRYLWRARSSPSITRPIWRRDTGHDRA